MKLVFFRILLLLSLFVFGLGNSGVQSSSILVGVGGQKFWHINDIVCRKFLREIASGQIDAAAFFHPFLQLRRNAKLRDKVIEIDNASRVLHFFADIRKALR